MMQLSVGIAAAELALSVVFVAAEIIIQRAKATPKGKHIRA